MEQEKQNWEPMGPVTKKANTNKKVRQHFLSSYWIC